MPNIAEDVNDLLQLTRMCNADIAHVNRHLVSSSDKMRPKIINPHDVLKGIELNGPIPQINPQPIGPAITTPTGETINITSSVPLIPLPEGYKPTQQTPLTSGTIPTVAVANTTPTPTSGDKQLEFLLPLEKRQDYNNVLDYFEDRYKKIMQQNDIINAKLNELLSRKRGAYGKRSTKLE